MCLKRQDTYGGPGGNGSLGAPDPTHSRTRTRLQHTASTTRMSMFVAAMVGMRQSLLEIARAYKDGDGACLMYTILHGSSTGCQNSSHDRGRNVNAEL